MKDIVYSQEQLDIFDEVKKGKGNILIEACAGSGKTFTIVESLDYVPNSKKTGFFAFNNHIVKELKSRCPSNVDITTLHSFGWSQLHRYYGRKLELNPNRVFVLADKLIGKKMEWKERGWYCFMLSKVIDLIRLNLVFNKKDILELCERHNLDFLDDRILKDVEIVLDKMYNGKHSFDFIDMIFLPAILDDIKLKIYDYVYVDEVQDLSIAQQTIIKRIVNKKSGRLICVGDSRQAIYGFAGSDMYSFKKIREIPNTKVLTLSTSYRCAKKIVEKAQEIVPTIQAFDKAPIGVYREGSVNEIRKGDWVLCRNVKPLVVLYFDLIKNGKKASIKGVEIGKFLISLLKSTKEKNIAFAIKKLLYKLEEVKKEVGNKYQSPEKHPKVVKLKEMISVIIFLSDKYKSVDNIIKNLDNIFKNKTDGGITLSTIHKSKGLENERIFIICPTLLPSKYAVQPWQLEQEENLRYVAYTRAKKELIIVDDFEDNVDDFTIHLRRFNKDQEYATKRKTEEVYS